MYPQEELVPKALYVVEKLHFVFLVLALIVNLVVLLVVMKASAAILHLIVFPMLVRPVNLLGTNVVMQANVVIVHHTATRKLINVP